jgi:pSer/pThr/pTyr-binding forkhead associated (FHA) protein
VTCTYCGRDNEAGAQFCIDCGKPLGKPSGIKAAAAVWSARGVHQAGHEAVAPEVGACPFCGAHANEGLPFCPQCGRRLTAPGSGPSCARCASPLTPDTRFCATCGAPFTEASQGLVRTSPSGHRTGGTITLVLLDETGTVMRRFDGRGAAVTIGRQEGDLRFPDDPFLSPLHAKISWERDRLVVRDLGSRNGTWVYLRAPHLLADGDLLLIGSQVIRFRRLGYPGPHAPDADATKRMGSLIPSADIASLTQLRSDGSARDVLQLSPGRDVQIGRERGDWTFPYDPSMSAVHATVRSEDADFVVIDANSRNGVALSARGDVALRHESRVLVGDKLLRVELPDA